MINLAENGVLCDCGSGRVVPATVSTGDAVICAACARTFRCVVQLRPVPWSDVESDLPEWDRCAFEWHRNGVPLALRRSLPELAATRSRYALSDRLGTVCGVVVLVVVALLVRAVLS